MSFQNESQIEFPAHLFLREIAQGPSAAADSPLWTAPRSSTESSQNFALRDTLHVQFRGECFNVANHANFGLPVTDLASPSFGRILEAAPPRLMQLGLKFLF
jgi:hypothetical protein